MSFLGSFNADDNEDSGFVLLPKGSYTAEIVGSDLKEAQSGNGQYVELHYRIHAEGQPIVIDRLNIMNKNPTAERIGKGKLAKVVKAIHKTTIRDTEELHGIPVKVTLGVEEASGNYPARNNIVDVQSAGSAPPPPPANEQKAPWAK